MNNYCNKKINGKTIGKHRYLWEKAYGAILDGRIVHHKNKIKNDNRLENLDMVTYSEHAKIHGVIPSEQCIVASKPFLFKYNSKPPNRLLNDKDAKMLKEMIKKRNKLSLRKLAKLLGFKPSLLQDVSAGRSYINI